MSKKLNDIVRYEEFLCEFYVVRVITLQTLISPEQVNR